MTALPSTIAPTTISGQISASPHNSNYAAIQVAINTLLGILDDGVAGQVLTGVGSSIGWGPNYTAYVPVWSSSGTAVALGNGTIAGNYVQVGKVVQGNILLTMGTTTTYGTGQYSFTLPIASTGVGNDPRGAVTIFDTSASATYSHTAVLSSATTILVLSNASPGTLISQGVPITFAVGDTININFTYQAS